MGQDSGAFVTVGSLVLAQGRPDEPSIPRTGQAGCAGAPRFLAGRRISPHLLSFFFFPLIYPPTLVHEASRATAFRGGWADPEK
jgi:hypothetical protein